MEEALAEVSFGDWLKRRRLGLGLTQDQLAQQLCCSTSALRKFESEERRPSFETIEQLADIFNIPIEDRVSFVRFARGDWQAFTDSVAENEPWRLSQIDLKSNLPSPFTSFIGREKELRDVIHLLNINRLVTLVGEGGIGKTRLAIQVGHHLRENYPDGVWLVALDSLFDGERLPLMVASVFGIRENTDRQVIEILMNVLHRKTSLIILDNCEHLLDSCVHLIKILLSHCPNLIILATSREILNMEGEATYYLPSLSTPELSDSLEKISECESIQLFLERATLVLSTFKLNKENALAIADLCRRVDGIPLAIELVVARVNILKIEEISKQLQKSFATLTNDSRTTLPRHRTLQASIDWSWSLLNDSEKVFLRQLSVFVGGWTLESAQSVCDGCALNLISSLAQKSLIMVEQGLKCETRYHFHETLHQYAHEKLVEAGEEETVRMRHLKYYLRLSEEIESGLLGSQQEELFAHAVYERDNLHAALEQAAKVDIEAGLKISSRLEAVWEKYDMREGMFWLTEFLLNPESKQYPLVRARALCAQGWLLFETMRILQAQITAKASLALFRDCHDQPGEIDALLLLGSTYFNSGDHSGGVILYQQALALSQSLGDIWRQAKANQFLGWDRTDPQRHFEYWEKALVLFREAGDQRSQVNLLCLIALFRVLNCEIELAEKYLDEAAMLFPSDRQIESGDNFLIAKTMIALERSDYGQAHTLLQEVLDYTEKSGQRYDYLVAQVHFGVLALREGNFSEAREIFANAAAEYLKYKEYLMLVFTLEGMAGVFVATGNPENAARLIGWADAARKDVSDPRPLLEQKDIDKLILACVSNMGKLAFTDAYDLGQVMTMDAAVALAVDQP
jgi:predicted ATPase/DNA-binding XRE family transcriptional regulator